MNKAADAFRTISEVADDLDIPQHVLRFWETRFASVRPLKRAGGRRYYRPDDVDLLKGIRHLLYGQGYTIKGVQRIIKDSGLRFVQEIGRGAVEGPPARRVPGTLEEDEAEPDGAADLEGGWSPEPMALVRPGGRAMRIDGAGEPAAPGLAPETRGRLRAALDELLECRRILDTLRRS